MTKVMYLFSLLEEFTILEYNLSIKSFEGDILQNILFLYKCLRKYVRFALGFCFILSLLYYNPTESNIVLLFMLSILLLVFDVLRGVLFQENRYATILTIASSLIAEACIVLSREPFDFMFAYYLFIILDLVKYYSGKKQGVALLIHLFMGSFTMLMKHAYQNELPLLNFVSPDFFIWFFTFTLIAYIVKTLDMERIKLTRLNAQILENSIQEQEYALASERSRISQELHDNLGHILMAISMKSGYILKILETDTIEIKTEIEEITELNKQGIAMLRNTVQDLKCLEVIDSLRAAIDKLISQFDYLDTVAIQVKIDANIDFAPPRVKLNLFKMIRESLTNVFKHSNCSKINIELDCIGSEIQLSVHDNGNGCHAIKKSNGLLGMEKYITDIGGTITFDGTSGFLVYVTVPYEVEK